MSLRLLVAQRKVIRSAVTRQYNDQNNYLTYTANQRSNLVMTIEGYKTKLEDLDDKICKLKFADDASLDGDSFQTEFDDCEVYKDKIHECLAELSSVAAAMTVSANRAAGVNGAPAVSGSLLRCPTAPLPKFTSAAGENFELFLSQFEDTISRYDYPSYDKLLLLKQQITGKALYLIDCLEPQQQTYEEAKKLLSAALASHEVQVFNILKQMTDLKLTYSTEPFQYIAEIKKIMNAFQCLNITPDDILQYFVLRGMNDSFRDCLVMITNKNHPDINDIVDNFFKANERYLVEQEKFKSRNRSDSRIKSNTMLLDTQVQPSKFNEDANPFRKCTLCVDDRDHAVNKCMKYPNAKDKIARLKLINGCCICANNDHHTNSCTFILRRGCSNCSKSHFTFLCPDLPVKTDGKRTSGSVHTVTVSNLSQLDGFGCIVPTFTCYVSNGLEEIPLRGLKDTGSQSNLIQESLLHSLDHEVINPSVVLQINGINNSKSYVSKLVHIKIRLGAKQFIVPFLTIPKINTSMKLPGLSSVAATFEERGYRLADEQLRGNVNEISNIQLILGSCSAYCFSYFTVHFGSSVFYRTVFGVMLDGNVSQMNSDLNELPYNNSTLYTFSAALNICDSEKTVSINDRDNNCLVNYDHLSTPITGEYMPSSEDMPIAATCQDRDYTGKASNDSLAASCNSHLNVDENIYNDSSVELDNSLTQFLLNTCTRNEEGRIIMPLLWNERVKHLLAQNFHLAKSILYGNLKKLRGDELKIAMIDDNIKALHDMNIVERVFDIENFVQNNPTCSFLAHMPIFKMSKETTKCRNVFMANLAEKSRDGRTALSHNQCMYAGPNLNATLSTALLLLRFNKYMFIFDLCKAFLQIELLPNDANKLLFLWFRDVKKGDYTLQAYRNLRLSFGLRCSPCILMTSLYKILIADTANDTHDQRALKEQVYSAVYMDNGSVSFDTSEELLWAYEELPDIFASYKFELQQFYSNVPALREKCKQEESVVSLLGILWNTVEDSLQLKRLKQRNLILAVLNYHCLIVPNCSCISFRQGKE